MNAEKAINHLIYLKIAHDIDAQHIINKEALDFAIKAIEQDPRWIPVSERLPEKEELYLVSVKNDHERRYSKTCWFHSKNNWFARQDIIAWMPLPEPYKTESEE